MCLDGVLIGQRRLLPSLELQRVVVKVGPARLGSRPVRLQERIVLNVFAVDLHRETVGGRFREQEALDVIGKRIAGVPA